MARTIHRTYDSWKTASPDDERDDEHHERDPDADRDDYMDEQLQNREKENAAVDVVSEFLLELKSACDEAQRHFNACSVLLEVLQEVDAYLDNRADVDDGIPNEAMRLQVEVRAAIRKAEGR